MGISVVMPVVDNHEITETAIDYLLDNASGDDLEVIIVDNASEKPYVENMVWYIRSTADGMGVIGDKPRVLRNDVNQGVYASYLQGMAAAKYNLVYWMHNDVLIHEQDWNVRIEQEFANDPLLGIAGLFGGRIVGADGGRGHPEGNLAGKVWGQNISVHGHLLTDTHPAVVFDSLSMIVRKDIFNAIDVPYVAPHHWFDRIMTLWFLDKGYHALTIGIEFDHMGGGTSVGKSNRHSDFVQRWCESKDLPMDQNWDNTLYQYGYRFFRNQWKGRFPVSVDKDHNVTWGYVNNDDDD